jgi:methyl-accepting chemotaxis protein
MTFMIGKIKSTIGAIPSKGHLVATLAPWNWIGAIRGRSQVHRAIDSLESLADELGAVGSRFEPHFMDLGTQLQTAFDEALQLTDQTQRTVRRIDGRKEDDLLSRVTHLAEASLVQLNSCCTNMSGSLASIDACVDHLKALNGQTNAIEKVAMVLRVIGLNIAVESSRSHEGRSMFEVVAEEVMALSQEILKTVSQLCQHAEEATQIQQEASREVIHAFQEACQLAQGAERSVRGAAADVEKLMAMAVSALESAGRHSREISEQVGQVVTGIQFHDSMSQRLEHMVAALSDLPQLCRSDTSVPVGGNGFASRLAEARGVVDLQCSQLGQVMVDAQAVHQKSKAAFETIYRQIDGLVSNLTDFARSPNALSIGSKARTDAFQNLLHALNHLHALLKKSASMRERIRMALNEAGASADNLTDQSASVRRVSHTIHLLALNAIVKAAHMEDRGRALEVLAQEVKILSHQADEFVDRYHRLLSDISSTSGDRHSVEDFAASPHEVENGIGKEISEITSAYECFQTEAQRAVTAAEGLKERIEAIQRDLEFFDELDAVLFQHREQLALIRADLDRWAQAQPSGPASLPSRLSQRYTMNQERRVHDQVIDTAAGGVTPGSEACVDDGIELFEEGSSSGETWADDGASEILEDFMEEAAALEEGASPDAGHTKEAFEDNVEFF